MHKWSHYPCWIGLLLNKRVTNLGQFSGTTYPLLLTKYFQHIAVRICCPTYKGFSNALHIHARPWIPTNSANWMKTRLNKASCFTGFLPIGKGWRVVEGSTTPCATWSEQSYTRISKWEGLCKCYWWAYCTKNSFRNEWITILLAQNLNISFWFHAKRSKWFFEKLSGGNDR